MCGGYKHQKATTNEKAKVPGGDGTLHRNVRSDLLHVCHHLCLGVKTLQHQAHALCLGAVESARRVGQLGGALVANDARQPLQRANVCNLSERNGRKDCQIRGCKK